MIDFEYQLDSILIESIMQSELKLQKHASISALLNLPGVAESLKNFVKQHINSDGPGGYVGSVLNLMAPSILFRAHPLIGMLYLIATQFGFDLQGIFTKIVNLIKPKLESGQKLTPEEISNAGKSVIASISGEAVTAAPQDLFEELRKYAAPYYSNSSIPETPLLFGGKGNILQKIFGQLFSMPDRRSKSKAIWLLGGFVIWILKTVLVGAGLVAGAETVSHMLGHNNTPSESNQQNIIQHEELHQQQANPEKQDFITSVTPSFIKNINPRDDLWIVPLLGGSIENTLLEWIDEFYPNKTNDIKNTHSFQSILSQLNDPKKVSSKYIVMPQQFSSRKEVVDEIMKGAQ